MKKLGALLFPSLLHIACMFHLPPSLFFSNWIPLKICYDRLSIWRAELSFNVHTQIPFHRFSSSSSFFELVPSSPFILLSHSFAIMYPELTMYCPFFEKIETSLSDMPRVLIGVLLWLGSLHNWKAGLECFGSILLYLDSSASSLSGLCIHLILVILPSSSAHH